MEDPDHRVGPTSTPGLRPPPRRRRHVRAAGSVEQLRGARAVNGPAATLEEQRGQKEGAATGSTASVSAKASSSSSRRSSSSLRSSANADTRTVDPSDVARPSPRQRTSPLPPPLPSTPIRASSLASGSTISLVLPTPSPSTPLPSSSSRSPSAQTPDPLRPPPPPLRKSEPGPSSAAGRTLRKGILKFNSSSTSLSCRSPSGSGTPASARSDDSHSITDSITAMSTTATTATTDASFWTASEGHEDLQEATIDDRSCWTPPVMHGIPIAVQRASLELAPPSGASRPSVGRSVPSPTNPLAQSFAFSPSPDATFSASAPSPLATRSAALIGTDPPAFTNTYFILSPHRRMSERDLVALAARTSIQQPKNDLPVQSPSKKLFGLPVLRRGKSEDSPRRDRSPSVVGGGKPTRPPLPERKASGGSSASSSVCCRGNGAIDGESLSDLVRQEERRLRRRSRTLGAYDVHQEQVPADARRSSSHVSLLSPPSQPSRPVLPETGSYLIPLTGGLSGPDDRVPSPNHVWRQSLLTEAVSFSLHSGSARSRESHLPAPPPPPPSEPPLSPSHTLKKSLTIKRRRATISAAIRPTSGPDANHLRALPPTPDLFGENPTIRRQASRPLLSESLFSSRYSASGSLDDEPSTPRPFDPSARSNRPRTVLAAPGPDFPPDFEDPALYASSASDPSHSGSSTRTLADLASETLAGSSAAALSVSVRDDDSVDEPDDAAASLQGQDDDSLFERGTLGERREKNKFGFSAIDEESLRGRTASLSQRAPSVLSTRHPKTKRRPGALSFISAAEPPSSPVVASPEAVDIVGLPRIYRGASALPSEDHSHRSVTGLTSSETARSSSSIEDAWAQPGRKSSAAVMRQPRGFYEMSATTLASSTPKLPSQHMTTVSTATAFGLPPVPPIPTRYEYQPTSPQLQDLDPRLPITNTLPKLPASPAAALKSFFGRRTTKYRPTVSNLSPAIPQPVAFGTALKRSRMTPVPVSAFAIPHFEPATTAQRVAAQFPTGRDRSIAAWAATTQTVRDPSLSRLEGMLHQHQELERERLKLIIHGQAGRSRTLSQT